MSGGIQIGYDGWTGISEDSEHHYAKENFIRYISFGRIIEKCYNLRGGIYCFLSKEHTFGSTSYFRQITFEDGKKWVVRIRFPAPTVGNEDANVKMCYESMKFLKEQTTVPVPEAHYCDASPTNAVGAPYILMDYIHGTPADDLRATLRYGENVFGTTRQNIDFRRQLAKIQVELASKKFDRIGRPSPDGNGGYHVVSTPTESTHGSSAEFYRRLASSLLQDASEKGVTVFDEISLCIPSLFERLVARWSTHQGPYGVALTGLGAHNVLVNRNFEIQGIIHPEGLIAVPLEIQAQMPLCMGLQPSPPHSLASSVQELTRITQEWERAREYISYLKEADIAHYAETLRDADDAPLHSAVLAPAAVIYQGLVEYRNFRELIDHKWLIAYANLLR
ncbi:hypothetical protein MGYG_03669 [Nannizzia gypsea CBS 118893]|uniref:Aminoglycoside phosphotransferase domain-containing protein n=1 Tax=Arthroderma gypseum (strain ATCC MYA-4604 / CBS 118893) TaxID=535722 RepID=E4UTA1_ARTGP|nr:hypothetical protein MGYG_03669 [Nannizzia gypsea CBS 118893]EFR00662.1 hypothetical protein MGYG_03669 [Nannizzia gypsea CBS 118893]